MSAPIPFGHYELLERIAEGGMAEVWRARSRGVAGFEKMVVIKRVLPSLLERPGFAELLVREAKIAARLSHPNIVQIYDLGAEEGGYFIAMELLRGRDLAAALSHRPAGETPLTLPLRLWIAAEVARALDYAHRARGEDGKPLNIVHRDISPQNVLLGFEGEVKVADFGIARADEPGLGRGEDPRILRGKFAYMSPEQARGEPLDRRSDIFSFGIVLFELVARRRMFRGKSSTETLDLLRRAELPPLPTDLPLPGLGPILARALAADAAERYASAGEIHAELQRVLFSLGVPVGQTDLAAVMHRMFPPADRARPNKLRVDVLIRAYEDATAASDPGRTRVLVPAATAASTENTHALPAARRRSDSRRLVFLAARARPDDARLFGPVVEATGGTIIAGGAAPPSVGSATSTLSSLEGVLVAVYGVAGMERAVGHAARAALEVRRQSRLEGIARLDLAPPIAVVGGEGKVLDGGLVEPSAAALERALALLARTDSAEIRVSDELRAELARDFRLQMQDGDLVIEGFRARRDRDAGAMRLQAPLLGRRDVLRALSGLLADTARGAGSLVHLLGEPGVGKSRVLAELRAAAAPKDFVFVHGRADEAEADRSFAPLADLVSDLCGLEPEDAPATRFAKVERLRVLGLADRETRLIGELLGLAYPWPSEERRGRPRAVELALALRKAIRTLADDRVVVLALEDLQWMDDATRQVLPLLVDGLTLTRVLVLLVRRPGSAGPLPGGRTLELSALDEPSTGRLIAHWLGARTAQPALAAWVHAETGGVPGWIELLAEPLGPRVRVVDEEVRFEGAAPSVDLLPDAIRAMLVARIERLRPRDRSMLRVVAAMGGTVEVRVASAVEGLVGRTERPIVRRLLARRLLAADGAHATSPDRLGAWGGDEEDPDLPSRVHMPSELLRRAVLSELDPTELGRLHARIVRTLERIGGEDLEALERLADHAARSTAPASAIAYLCRAADAARAAGEGRRAASYLMRAALVALDAADPTEGSALALRAAEQALEADALELVPVALDAVDPTTPALAVRRALLEARWARRRLDPAQAVRALEATPRATAGVELRIEAAVALVAAQVEAGRAREALAQIEHALEEAEGAARGRLLATRAAALALEDRIGEAEIAVSEALAIAARSGEVDLRYVALAAMAAVLEARGEPAAAAGRYAEAAELALTIGEWGDLPRLFARAAALWLYTGDHGEAAARASDAAGWAARLGQESWGWVAAGIEEVRGGLARETFVPGFGPSEVEVIEGRLIALDRRQEAALVAEVRAMVALAAGDVAATALALERASELARGAGFLASARRLAERRATLHGA